MNFSMAVKEAIFNTSDQYKVTASGDLLKIEGFGTFHKTQVVSALAQRYIPGVAATLTFNAPSASDIGLASGETKVPVTLSLKVNSVRHSAEWATSFIEAGRPFMVDLLLDATDTATQVAAKIKSALEAYNKTWPNAPLPFTVSGTNPAVKLTGKYFDLYFEDEVTFVKQHSAIGDVVTGTTTMSAEPRVDGKYLEENVRMSTPSTEGIYAIKPGEVPAASVGYTTINFKVKETKDAGVDGSWQPHANQGITANDDTGTSTMDFSLYLSEDACMASNGPVATIVNFLAVTAGAGWGTFYVSSGAPVTVGADDAATLANFLNNV
jgi:hypothetical protein